MAILARGLAPNRWIFSVNDGFRREPSPHRGGGESSVHRVRTI